MVQLVVNTGSVLPTTTRMPKSEHSNRGHPGAVLLQPGPADAGHEFTSHHSGSIPQTASPRWYFLPSFCATQKYPFWYQEGPWVRMKLGQEEFGTGGRWEHEDGKGVVLLGAFGSCQWWPRGEGKVGHGWVLAPGRWQLLVAPDS